MRKSKQISNNRYWLLGLIAGIIIVVIAILELTNTTHIFHKQKVPPVIPAHTNTGQPISSSKTPSQSSGSGSNNSSPVVPPATVANHTLISPYGNFVSNHFPGQNGTSTSEASVCNTSPGAACYIKFTNIANGDTTQLASQTADAQGYTSWYWDINNDAHLSTGKWKVEAVASLGDQTKTAADALNLVVQ